MPRSLEACVQQVVDTAARARNRVSGGTQMLALNLLAELQDHTIEEISEHGLHAFLTEFLARVNAVGSGISKDFLGFPPTRRPGTGGGCIGKAWDSATAQRPHQGARTPVFACRGVQAGQFGSQQLQCCHGNNVPVLVSHLAWLLRHSPQRRFSSLFVCPDWSSRMFAGRYDDGALLWTTAISFADPSWLIPFACVIADAGYTTPTPIQAQAIPRKGPVAICSPLHNRHGNTGRLRLCRSPTAWSPGRPGVQRTCRPTARPGS